MKEILSKEHCDLVEHARKEYIAAVESLDALRNIMRSEVGKLSEFFDEELRKREETVEDKRQQFFEALKEWDPKNCKIHDECHCQSCRTDSEAKVESEK